MVVLPDHEILVFGNGDRITPEAEEMFAPQLADSRRPLPADRPDKDRWRFALACAVTPAGHVLGGVHLDIGPINGDGPLADRKLANLEHVFVRPEHRRRGLATRLMQRAIEAAEDAGCLYVRCSDDWDNPAETALFLRCGFALVDLNGEGATEPCYLAVCPISRRPSAPAAGPR
jgi:GNAT superfamily N-acetyltransferase